MLMINVNCNFDIRKEFGYKVRNVKEKTNRARFS